MLKSSGIGYERREDKEKEEGKKKEKSGSGKPVDKMKETSGAS